MTPKKTVIVSLAAIGAAALLYYAWKKTKSIGLLEKSTRSVSFSTSYCLSGLSGVSLSLPVVEQSFYSENEITQIQSKIAAIRSKYGLLISNIAGLTNVPESVITSFIFIESAGNPAQITGNATGLMQVGSNSATDIVYMEYKKGRLGAGEIAILQHYLGTRYDSIKAMRSPGLSQFVTTTDLLIPELNILIGSIFLGQLMDESIKADGDLRMDKVVVRYNMGYYSYNKGASLPATASDTINTINSITGQYIVKLIGRNGILELLEAEHCAQ